MMIPKKIFTFLAISLIANAAASAFTIINQTDIEMTLKFEEAYRPRSDDSNLLTSPIPLSSTAHEIKVAAKSIETFHELQPCSDLLVSVTTKSKKKKKEKIVTTTTCYAPYSYNGQIATEITDDWGIVIHEPLLSHGLRDTAQNLLDTFNKKNQGYALKCLHPDLLKKVISLDALPKELTKDYWDKTSKQIMEQLHLNL